MRTQGGGGVSGKKRTSSNLYFYQNCRSLILVSCVLRTTFDSSTNINNLDLSPMSLNRLMLDLTVIDLMSIVHLDRIWVEIA